MISKQTKKINWLKSAGGDEALKFLAPILDTMQTKSEEQMLEKQNTTETEVTGETAVNTNASETSAETSVNAETAVEETAKKNAPEQTDVVTLADFEEIATSLIKAIEDQKTEIANLQKEVADLTVKVNSTVEKQTELEDSQLPAATSASLVKERLFARLNNFGTPLTEGTVETLVKNSPKEKVKTEQLPEHVLNGLVQGF